MDCVAGALAVVLDVKLVGIFVGAGNVPVWDVVVVASVAVVVAKAEMAVEEACVGVVTVGAAGGVVVSIVDVEPDGTVRGIVVVRYDDCVGVPVGVVPVCNVNVVVVVRNELGTAEEITGVCGITDVKLVGIFVGAGNVPVWDVVVVASVAVVVHFGIVTDDGVTVGAAGGVVGIVDVEPDGTVRGIVVVRDVKLVGIPVGVVPVCNVNVVSLVCNDDCSAEETTGVCGITDVKLVGCAGCVRFSVVCFGVVTDDVVPTF